MCREKFVLSQCEGSHGVSSCTGCFDTQRMQQWFGDLSSVRFLGSDPPSGCRLCVFCVLMFGPICHRLHCWTMHISSVRRYERLHTHRTLSCCHAQLFTGCAGPACEWTSMNFICIPTHHSEGASVICSMPCNKNAHAVLLGHWLWCLLRCFLLLCPLCV